MTSNEISENPPALRAVVFDLDGIIANTEDLYELAGEMVLARRGKTYDAELREQVMGRPAVDAIQIMIDCHSLSDTADELMRECAEVLQQMIATSLAPMPGAVSLIEDLQAANVPIAVATSSTPDYADNVLTRLNLKQRFRFILTAADIHRGKPDPEIYLLAAAQLGLAPPQMMVFEDSGNGCRAAVDAGAFTIAVPNHHTHKHNFTGARFVADTLNDPRIRASLHLS